MRMYHQEISMRDRWQWVPILLSLFIAMCLSVMHWSGFMANFHVQWVWLVVMFWSIQPVTRVTVLPIWCVGLYLDFLEGSVLGLNALLCVIILFVGMNHRKMIGSLPLWLQVIFIFFVSIALHSIVFFVFFCLGDDTSILEIGGQSVLNACAWPIVVWALKSYVFDKGRY